MALPVGPVEGEVSSGPDGDKQAPADVAGEMTGSSDAATPADAVVDVALRDRPTGSVDVPAACGVSEAGESATGMTETAEEVLPIESDMEGWLELLRDGYCRQLREENEYPEPPPFHRAMSSAVNPGEPVPEGKFPRQALNLQLQLLLRARAGDGTASAPSLAAAMAPLLNLNAAAAAALPQLLAQVQQQQTHLQNSGQQGSQQQLLLEAAKNLLVKAAGVAGVTTLNSQDGCPSSPRSWTGDSQTVKSVSSKPGSDKGKGGKGKGDKGKAGKAKVGKSKGKGDKGKVVQKTIGKTWDTWDKASWCSGSWKEGSEWKSEAGSTWEGGWNNKVSSVPR